MCKALGWVGVGVKPWVESLSAEGTVRGRELELITENLDPSGVLERPAACGREDAGARWAFGALRAAACGACARRATRVGVRPTAALALPCAVGSVMRTPGLMKGGAQ